MNLFLLLVYQAIAIILWEVLWHAYREFVPKKRSAPQQSAPKREEGETYGHPRAPVQALYDALPPPPDSHAWEIEVVPTKLEHRDPLVNNTDSLDLELRLVNLADPQDDPQVVHKMSKDLLWGSWYDCIENDCTWASEYRRSRYDSRYIFRDKLITPFVDWATTIVENHKMRSYAASAEGEYRMKGA